MEIYQVKQHNLFLVLLAITIATSSIVQVEPAPYEFFIMLTIFLAFCYQYATFQVKHFWPIIFLLFFILINLISSVFIGDISQGLYYIMITFYLIISWIGIAAISNYFGTSILPFIFNGYVIAAMISVLFGIIAYIGWAPSIEKYVLYGDRDRILGFFKDPNVFGPFLIPPTLYSLWKLNNYGIFHKKGVGFFFVFLFLTFGVLLSFSRAAWGHFILSFIIYLFVVKKNTVKRLKLIFLLILIIIPILFYFITSTKIGNLFYDRLGLQSYDNYRFQNQMNALDYLIRYPLGFGPGQSETFLDFSTHSLYVRLLFENGFLGFISFISFYLLCLARSFKLLIISPANIQGYYAIILASLIGILFNSIFIDTMHWRHLWLLLALPFMDIEVKRFKNERI